MLVDKHCQKGVTLVEAMIALLVISIGLLGIASLQITAMNQNASSLHHSQAVWYAYNMSDRIRANMSEFANYDGIDTSDGFTQDCVTSACSNSEMIDSDAAEWEAMVSNLPAGRGIVSNNVDGFSNIAGLVVTVMWDDNGNGATGTGCDPDNSNDLVCYRVAITQ